MRHFSDKFFKPFRVAPFSLGSGTGPVWIVRVGGDDGELLPWHYTYVYSIESRHIMRT